MIARLDWPAALSSMLLQEPSTPELLETALQLAHGLADLHRQGRLQHGDAVVRTAFLAPEQTGRIGRPVDARTDLYALGATLYERLTGRPPFDEDGDPLQLIHQLLALPPVPPLILAPATPPALSALVMKLLEKEPDRRYQSAEGLAADLARLLLQATTGGFTDFELGEHDFAARLTPPARPIGRDAELAALQDAFDAALRGQGGGALIAGGPGVGKTTLIDQLRPLVASRHGWFIGGKFDQYRRDLRADAIWQAMSMLSRLLLAEPETELAVLRPSLLQALGSNAALAASMHPEFSLLLGVAPEANNAGDPAHAERRLVQTALALLRGVVSLQRPLVLVVDDLQWAATASLAFVDGLLSGGCPDGLLFVGAYRDSEVDAGHPLAALCDRWQRLAPPPLALALPNLPLAGLGELLAEMLRLAPPQAAELAELLAERTAGNPFDSVELVNALRHDGLLLYGEAGWRWDAAEIRRHVGHGDVVDLLTARIARLPPATGETLVAMACLGGEVEPALLAAACGHAPAELAVHVAPALEDGLLVGTAGTDEPLRFRHDRVQQAAIERLADGARQALQLQLARRLAGHAEFAAVAAAQYLAVAGVIEGDDERRVAARLLHAAAAQTRHANNTLAERLLASARELLATAGGDTPLQATLALEHHAMLYTLGRLTDADAVYERLRGSIADSVQRAAAGSLQIASLTNRGRAPEALVVGFALLAELGQPPPPANVAAHLQNRLDALCRWANDTAEDLERPPTTDARILAAAGLLNSMLVTAFFCDRAMMAWLVLESHRLWVEHGPCAALISNLGATPVFTAELRGDFRSGYLAACRAIRTGRARGWESDTARALFARASFALHWFEPHENAGTEARLACESLVRHGDLQIAGLTFSPRVFSALDCASLDTLDSEVQAALAMSARSSNDYLGLRFPAFGRFVRRLRGDPDADAGDAALRQQLLNNPPALAHFHLLHALSALIFGHGDTLDEQLAAAQPLLPAIEPTYHVALAKLLQALALAARLKAATGDERAALRADFDARVQWVRERAADAPTNFAPWLPWLEAERAWACAQPFAAAHAFDAALQAITPRQRPWQRALIAERAARFQLEHGMTYGAQTLFAEAARRYADWGAMAKVRQIEAEHGLCIADTVPAPAASAAVSADAIDMLAVVRASQALSSETSLESLRQRVVELLAGMTGATAVHVVLWNDESRQWRLARADGGIDIGGAAAQGLLPLSVLRYVERTGEPLLLDDATRDDRFAADSYLADVARCSLLAVPIRHHGALRALLLLENRLGRGAFGADRLDAVTLITGQLAVSLANAQLYEQLEQRVHERTRELQEAQSQLLGAAHQAGMAEIAANVLHNVGNVLNSVNISAGLIGNQLQKSKVKGLARAVAMIDEHAADLGAFLTADAKGRLLPTYLRELSSALVTENTQMNDEMAALVRSVDHIKEVVAMQQSHAGAPRMVESLALDTLIDDALRMNAGSLTRHKVTVVKALDVLPALPLDRHRLLQIMVNLISNAKQAMGGIDDPCIRLGAALTEDGERRLLRITVADNGEGIPPENLTRIFSHGFTTRKTGHGFGLHSCALAAKEMGGSLVAHSDGRGRGATFILDLPVDGTGSPR